MARNNWTIGVVLCLLAWQAPAAFSAGSNEAAKPRVSVSQKLLSTIERDLQTFLEVVANLESPTKDLPQAQRVKVYDLHSRAQRNIRVVQLQQARTPRRAATRACLYRRVSSIRRWSTHAAPRTRPQRRHR
jgi:hypothetical protein